jgi:hypothetical protein
MTLPMLAVLVVLIGAALFAGLRIRRRRSEEESARSEAVQRVRDQHVQQTRLDRIAKDSIQAVESRVAGSGVALYAHHFYGVTGIHPRYLTIWYIFQTDAELERAIAMGLTSEIESITRSELAGRGYPPETVPDVSIGFVSHEDVMREAGGSYHDYFK